MEDQRLKVKDLGIASMEAGAGRQKIQWLLARCPRFLHSFHDYILRVDYILSAARHRGCTDGIKKKKLTPDLIVFNIIIGERQNQGGRK